MRMKRVGLMITSILMLFAATSYAAQVELVHGLVKRVQTPGSSCPACYVFSGQIELEDTAFKKDVAVHYSINGRPWRDIHASYLKSIGSNREIWTFFLNTGYVPGGIHVRFAVRYEVAGQTSWDNNNYLDYHIAATPAVAGSYINKYALFQDNARIVGPMFKGSIHLINIAFQKDVAIVYTYDNWATTLVANAKFKQMTANPMFEMWEFNTPVPAATTNVEFALAYTVANATHWDNNYGDNHIAVMQSF